MTDLRAFAAGGALLLNFVAALRSSAGWLLGVMQDPLVKRRLLLYITVTAKNKLADSFGDYCTNV